MLNHSFRGHRYALSSGSFVEILHKAKVHIHDCIVHVSICIFRFCMSDVDDLKGAGGCPCEVVDDHHRQRAIIESLCTEGEIPVRIHGYKLL